MATQQPNRTNPYAAPSTPKPVAAGKPGASSGICCPKCGGTESKSPSFTLWGGAVGHRILSHVNCTSCGAGYNSKTGKSNLTAIIIYQVVLFAIFAAVGAVLYSM